MDERNESFLHLKLQKIFNQVNSHYRENNIDNLMIALNELISFKKEIFSSRCWLYLINEIKNLARNLLESHDGNKIIKLTLLSPQFLEIYSQMVQIDNTVPIITNFLRILSDDDLNLQNFVINKLTEMSENNNVFFEPCAWNTDSFVDLIHICMSKLKNPSRHVLIDATLILKIIINFGPQKFSQFLLAFFEHVPLHYFNLNILQSLKFGDLIIKFIKNCEKINEIFFKYFCEYFRYGVSHKNFCQLFEHAYQNINSEKKRIIELLINLSQSNDPVLLNYWYFPNLSNDDDITIEYDRDLISKTGISIIFEISTFIPFLDNGELIPNMPILWINAKSNPKCAILLLLDSKESAFKLCLFENNISIYNLRSSIKIACFSHLKCMLSVHVLNNMVRLCISVGDKLIESEYFENPIKNFSLNKPSFVFGYYPHFDSGITGVDKDNCSRNFVGRIGKIHILENFSSLDHFWNPESNQKFEHINLNTRFQKSKLISFAPGANQNNLNVSSNYNISIFQNGSVYHHKNVHFNYYFENYGGSLIWLVFLDSAILNKTCYLNLYDKDLIENLSMCYLNLTANYVTKTRFSTRDLTLVIHIFHYFLYLHRKCSLVVTQRVVEFFNNNIELAITGSNSSTFMPFYHLLISPIIWSDFPFEIQTLRMRIICEITDNSIIKNEILPISIDNMLYYIDQVNNSDFQLAQKNEIFVPVFKIFLHILLNSTANTSLQSFYDYFINHHASPSFDIMTLNLIFKFSDGKKLLNIIEISLISRLISKIMLQNTHSSFKLISHFFIDFLNRPLFDQLFPDNVIVGWFCLLIMDNSCLDSDIHFLVNAIFTFFLNSKFDSRNSDYSSVRLFIWSFILTQRISLKHRISLITKFFKILEEKKLIKRIIVSVNYVDIFLTTPLLKKIPFIFLNSLKKDLRCDTFEFNGDDQQKQSYFSCEFDSDKVNDNFKATTIIQQISSIYLTIYLHHHKPFEFLMFPIFCSEIYGSSTMFFDCWSVKISIINSYLRHFYHLDSEKTNITQDSIQIDIFVRFLETVSFLIMEIASLDMREINDQQIDILDECIHFLGLSLVKHLKFSPQHFHIPLIITLRFINFGCARIISTSCGYLERCLDLCKPTLFHICAVISLLYKAYHNLKTEESTKKILIFTIESIVKKYCSLFQNAGIGSQKFSSVGSRDVETAINNMAVENNGDTLNFDESTWKQVLVWSDEHPLMICWLSNPSLLCENLRKLVSDSFDQYMSFLETDFSSFVLKEKILYSKKVSPNINYYSILPNLTDSFIIWNTYVINIYESLLNSNPIHIKKLLFLGSYYSPLIYPFFFPVNQKLFFQDHRCLIRFFLQAEYFCHYIKSQVVPLRVCIRKNDNPQTTCYLMFLGECFEGKLYVENEEIFFQEIISHANQPLFNVKVNIYIKEINKIYYSTGSNLHWTLEIFTKYSSSLYFEFSDKHSLDLVVKSIGSSQNSVFIYSHSMSITAALKNENDWKQGVIDNITYLFQLNMLYNNSFHSYSNPILLPKLSEETFDSKLKFPKLYYQLFKGCQPFLSTENLNEHSIIDCDNSFDPFSSLVTFKNFIDSNDSNQIIHKFVESKFGKFLLYSNDPNKKDISSLSLSGSNGVSNNGDKTNSISNDRLKFSTVNIKHSQQLDNILPGSIICVSKLSTNKNSYDYFVNIMTEKYLFRYNLCCRRNSRNLYKMLSNMFISTPSSYTLIRLPDIKIDYDIGDIFRNSIKPFRASNIFLQKKDSSLLVIGGFIDNIILVYGPHDLIAILNYHTDIVTCFDVYDKDGIVVSGSKDGICCLWYLKMDHIAANRQSPTIILKPSYIFFGHNAPLVSISHSMVTQSIASYDSDNILCIHSLKSGLLSNKSNLNPGFLINFGLTGIGYTSSGLLISILSFKKFSKIQQLSPYGLLYKETTFEKQVTSFYIADDLLIILYEKRFLEIFNNANRLFASIFEHDFVVSIDQILAFDNASSELMCVSGQKLLIFQISADI